MINDFLRENKRVITFYVIFTMVWVAFVLGVCQLIPERMRKGGWFVEPGYQHSASINRQ